MGCARGGARGAERPRQNAPRRPRWRTLLPRPPAPAHPCPIAHTPAPPEAGGRPPAPPNITMPLAPPVPAALRVASAASAAATALAQACGLGGLMRQSAGGASEARAGSPGAPQTGRQGNHSSWTWAWGGEVRCAVGGVGHVRPRNGTPCRPRWPKPGCRRAFHSCQPSLTQLRTSVRLPHTPPFSPAHFGPARLCLPGRPGYLRAPCVRPGDAGGCFRASFRRR